MKCKMVYFRFRISSFKGLQALLNIGGSVGVAYDRLFSSFVTITVYSHFYAGDAPLQLKLLTVQC